MTFEEAIEDVKGRIQENGDDLSSEDYLEYLQGLRDEISILIDAAKHEVRSKRGGG